jgi:biopolymer transport protein ExbD
LFELEDEEGLEIQMAPLIDCVFLLLIFFLVTSTLKKVQFELPLELPAAAHTAQAPTVPELLVLAVDISGQVFVDAAPVTTDQLLARIREATAAYPDLHIRIDGDRQAAYGQVVRLLDELHAVGIKQVGLKTTGPINAK